MDVLVFVNLGFVCGWAFGGIDYSKISFVFFFGVRIVKSR